MKWISLVLLCCFLSGCSVTMLAKDCKPVQDDNKFACKTLKPWD